MKYCENCGKNVDTKMSKAAILTAFISWVVSGLIFNEIGVNGGFSFVVAMIVLNVVHAITRKCPECKGKQLSNKRESTESSTL